MKHVFLIALVYLCCFQAAVCRGDWLEEAVGEAWSPPLIVLDSHDNPHLFYQQSAYSHWYHSWSENGDWITEELADIGTGSSKVCVASDIRGRLHIAWLTAYTYEIHHSTLLPDGWHSELVMDISAQNGLPGIALDITDSGKPVILYFGSSLGTVCKNRGQWEVSEYLTGVEISYSDIAVDLNGNYHITYTQNDDTEDTFNYAKVVRGQFYPERLKTNFADDLFSCEYGLHSTIQVNNDQEPEISYIRKDGSYVLFLFFYIWVYDYSVVKCWKGGDTWSEASHQHTGGLVYLYDVQGIQNLHGTTVIALTEFHQFAGDCFSVRKMYKSGDCLFELSGYGAISDQAIACSNSGELFIASTYNNQAKLSRSDPEVKYSLALSDPIIRPGDNFCLVRTIRNRTPTPFTVDEFIAVEVAGEFLFYPEWNSIPQSMIRQIPGDYLGTLEVFSGIWPGSGNPAFSMCFWGGLTDINTNDLIGFSCASCRVIPGLGQNF